MRRPVMGCTLPKCMMVLVLLFIDRYRTEGCHSVSLEDAIIAARAARCIYRIDDSAVGTNIPETSFEIKKFISFQHREQPLKALIARHQGTTIISFQGTKTKKQLLQEFKSALKAPIKIQYNSSDVSVMPFFWDAFNKFDANVLIPNPSSKEKYILTGHSLGGALADLMAIHTRTEERLSAIWEHPDSSLITFGEPRVGDKSYAQLHDRYISPKRKLRFVNKRDIIPHVPPRFKGYYHHSREIWIRSKKSSLFSSADTFWIACPFNDEKDNICSNNLKLKTISQHGSAKYLKVLTTKPEGFYDRFNNFHETFQEALCV